MLGVGELGIIFHGCSANWEQGFEGRLFSLGERIFAVDGGCVGYGRGDTVYFMGFYWFSVITQALVTCSDSCKQKLYHVNRPKTSWLRPVEIFPVRIAEK